MNNNQTTVQISLDTDITIQDLVAKYPQLVDVLIEEYGFHCVTCFLSEFETLREGAKVHGIEESDFDELMERLDSVIQTSNTNTVTA
jgi:hybrid cluster-associated redox disulfide protein